MRVGLDTRGDPDEHLGDGAPVRRAAEHARSGRSRRRSPRRYSGPRRHPGPPPARPPTCCCRAAPAARPAPRRPGPRPAPPRWTRRYSSLPRGPGPPWPCIGRPWRRRPLRAEGLPSLPGNAGGGAPRRRRTRAYRPRSPGPGRLRLHRAGRHVSTSAVSGNRYHGQAARGRLRRGAVRAGGPLRARRGWRRGSRYHWHPWWEPGRQRMLSWPALVAQGIEHRPPEPGA